MRFPHVAEVIRTAIIDIVPTLDMWAAMKRAKSPR
jgi:hypothetical protein